MLMKWTPYYHMKKMTVIVTSHKWRIDFLSLTTLSQGLLLSLIIKSTLTKIINENYSDFDPTKIPSRRNFIVEKKVKLEYMVLGNKLLDLSSINYWSLCVFCKHLYQLSYISWLSNLAWLGIFLIFLLRVIGLSILLFVRTGWIRLQKWPNLIKKLDTYLYIASISNHLIELGTKIRAQKIGP